MLLHLYCFIRYLEGLKFSLVRFLLFSMLFFATIFTASSQLVFEVNEPFHLRGIYPSIAPQLGWGSPNLNINGAWFSDTILIANDGNIGSACGTLNNSVAGQFVLFQRNSCSIADQLLNVQNQGASGALIIDNVVGRPLPFDTLDQAFEVTIPFIIISKDEGDSLLTSLSAGETAIVSFGDKTTSLNSDLGIYMERSIWSSYGYFKLEGNTYFTDTLLGSWIYNHGNSIVNDAQLQFYLKGKSSTLDYAVTSEEIQILPGDSVYVPLSFPFIIDFSGEMNGLDYGYSIISSTVDEDTLDNYLQKYTFPIRVKLDLCF